LKIPARRAEYSLTENVASPFQAEPRQYERNDQKFLLIRDRAERVLKRHPNYRREFDGISDEAVRPEADKGTQFGLAGGAVATSNLKTVLQEGPCAKSPLTIVDLNHWLPIPVSSLISYQV
jgi:hypothetical protein